MANNPPVSPEEMRAKLQEYFGQAPAPDPARAEAAADMGMHAGMAQAGETIGRALAGLPDQKSQAAAGYAEGRRQQLAQALQAKQAAAQQNAKRQAIMDKLMGQKAQQDLMPKEGDEISADTKAKLADREKQRAHATQLQENRLKAEKELALLRAKSQGEKEDDSGAINIPGYEQTGEVDPRPADAAKLRKAVATREQLHKNIDKLDDLFTKYGSTQMVGKGSGEMSTTHTDLLLNLKTLHELGALQKPDLILMEKMLSDPTGFSSLFERTEISKEKLQSLKTLIDDRTEAEMSVWGYKEKGEGGKTPTEDEPLRAVEEYSDEELLNMPEDMFNRLQSQ